MNVTARGWAYAAQRRISIVGATLVVATLLTLVVAPPLAAQQQGQLDVAIRSADVNESGETELVINVTGLPPGELQAADLAVTEAGEDVGDFELSLATDLPDPEPRTVVVAIDLSGSTQGPPLDNALAAVEGFVQTVSERNVAVGLVTFSDEAQLVIPPTGQTGRVIQALNGLEAGGETALYDAVVVASRALSDVSGQRSLVVFSDGADTASTAELEGAVSAASFVGAPITAVALVTNDFDPAPLQRMATSTGGRVLEVDSADQLQGAFEEVAQGLEGQYVVTYPNTGRTGQFAVDVQVDAQAGQASDTIDVLNTVDAGTAATPNVSQVPPVDSFGTRNVLLFALAAVAIGLALLLLVIFMSSTDRQVGKTLRRAMPGGGGDGNENRDLSPATGAMSRRAVTMVESLPKPEGYDDKMQASLDRAAFPLRASEFTAMRIIATLVGALVGWLGLGSWILGLVLGAAAWFVPSLVISQRIASRQKQFMEQLPDTLQLLSGSLKAGYGVLQAIDTVVKETGDPTSTEFKRVLTESRLGLPLEDSLSDMADRLGTEDFRWVAVAINIQRRVGGNLAQLLETVANTLRERAATRRQIVALSAEGRLSGIVLVALPFMLAAYLWVTNPDYLGSLVFHPMGQAMLVAVGILMVAGIFWMRNMIDIDV